MDDIDIAWFAGLFEGEGCISIANNGGTRLTVRMTDLDIVERVNSLFPCNRIQVVEPKPVRPEYNQPKTQYAWRMGKPEKVREILGLILPFLGERRTAKALETLAHLDARPGAGGYQRAKTHCPKGHEYTVENTVHGRDGNATYRRCKLCLKTWWTTSNQARKPEQKTRTGTCMICGSTFEYTIRSRARTLCSEQCRVESRRKNSQRHRDRQRAAA